MYLSRKFETDSENTHEHNTLYISPEPHAWLKIWSITAFEVYFTSKALCVGGKSLGTRLRSNCTHVHMHIIIILVLQ